MVRKVFFSFHYERDIWRSSIVRNSDVTKKNVEAAGFIDSASWEAVKKKGDDAIRKWIAEQLNGTSVTVVLIGTETSDREWVKYEIKESYKKGNGLLGIYIHNIEDDDGKTDAKGNNTFGELGKDANGNSVYFYQVAKTYDWKGDKGYENFGRWVEEAAPKN